MGGASAKQPIIIIIIMSLSDSISHLWALITLYQKHGIPSQDIPSTNQQVKHLWEVLPLSNNIICISDHGPPCAYDIIKSQTAV